MAGLYQLDATKTITNYTEEKSVPDNQNATCSNNDQNPRSSIIELAEHINPRVPTVHT